MWSLYAARPVLSDDPEGNGGAERRLPRCARVTGMGHLTLGRARVHQKEASCKLKLGLQSLARPALIPVGLPDCSQTSSSPSPYKVRIASSTNLVRPVPSSTFFWHIWGSPSCIFLQLHVHLALCCQLPQVTITHRTSKTPSEPLESLFARVGSTSRSAISSRINLVSERPLADQPAHPQPRPATIIERPRDRIRRFAIRSCSHQNNHVCRD